MALIRNNKPARVGLPTKKKDGKAGPTLYFEPGTHAVAEDDLDSLDEARASVRVYFEPQGDKPAVLEDVTKGGGQADPKPDSKKSAAEVKKLIAASDDPDYLRGIMAKDDRTTVIAAADARLAELAANMAAAGNGDGSDEGGDGATDSDTDAADLG